MCCTNEPLLFKGDAAERQSIVNGYEQNTKNEIEEVELTLVLYEIVCPVTIQQVSDAAGESVTLLCDVQFIGSG